MRKFSVLLALILLGAACQAQPVAPVTTSHYQSTVHIGNAALHIDIANDDASRNQGLSGRIAMAEDQGMLFDFTPPLTPPKLGGGAGGVRPGFWMKDMRFGLDLIWVSKNKVTEITRDIPPPQTGEQLKVYYPASDIDAVIETNAGWTGRHGVKVGDEVKL